LLTHVLETEIPRGHTPAYLHVDFYRPVPVGYSEVSVERTRESASIRGLSASMRTIDREVAKLSAMWVKDEQGLPESEHAIQGPVQGPDECEPLELPVRDGGYTSAIEVRVVSGTWQQTDHLCAWLRLRNTLLPNAAMSPIASLMTLIDSCAGLAQPIDIRTHTFLNADLSVRLQRAPRSEWICIDARSTTTEHGLGLSDARIFDEQGFLGSASQTLLIRARANVF
jgi:acyl-CoA thioesterase